MKFATLFTPSSVHISRTPFSKIPQWAKWSQSKWKYNMHYGEVREAKSAKIIIIIIFIFFDLGFTALSRIFHLYRADRSSKVGENRSTRRKTTWPSVSRTWLSHIWPELGSNHSGEKPNGLRVNSLIHQATGARKEDYWESAIKM